MKTPIPPVDSTRATPDQAALLATVRQAMGGVPNLLATLAQSPAAGQAYLAFSQTLSKGVLSPAVREQIALAVAQANACGYCLAAHTALGARAGLTPGQVIQARRGTADEPKVAALLGLAGRIVERRGRVDAADLTAARRAGAMDAELVEVVANVALNIYTNYLNHVAGTEVDFPSAPELTAA